MDGYSPVASKVALNRLGVRVAGPGWPSRGVARAVEATDCRIEPADGCGIVGLVRTDPELVMRRVATRITVGHS